MPHSRPITWLDETDPLGPPADTSTATALSAAHLNTMQDDLAAKIPYLDVQSDYGATPSTTNPETLIQTAIDDANASWVAGGGQDPVTVRVGPGTYTVDIHTITGQTTVAAAIYLRSGVILWLDGATLKLKNSATLPGSSTQGHIISVIKPFATSLSDTKTTLGVRGGIIDGNASNQSSVVLQSGIFMGSSTNFVVDGTLAKNIYGTSNVPPGETFHFEANNCKGGAFRNCEADGSGSANTATGFSSDNSYGVKWIGCDAHGMGFGQGFTCWQSAGLAWMGCNSYSNGTYGFNAERSEGLRWSACHAGGKSPLIGNGDPESPFFSSGQVTLANGTAGFSISGCTDAVVGADCTSTYNPTNLDIHTNTGGTDPAKACSNVVAYGLFRHATSVNVHIEDSSEGGSAKDQSGCMVLVASDDGIPDAMNFRGHAPYFEYRDVSGVSGIRHILIGINSDTDGSAYRWLQKDGDVVLAVDRARRLISVGRVKGYRAVSSNTTITAKDHVLSVDSSGGAYTLTLPQFGTVGGQVTVLDGTEYIVTDFGSNAAVNNITIACAGSDTFVDGSTSKTIFQNAGICQIIATNSKWKVVQLEPGYKHRSPWKLSSGEEVMPRLMSSGTYTLTSGQLRLAFFTAETTETISQVALACVAAQSGTAPTLIRYGIYTEASNGDISLTKSTTSDTTLFGSGSSRSTKSLSANLSKVAGQRYAIGALVVTTGTAPTAAAQTVPAAESTQSPRLAALLTGQSDLPLSVTNATLNGAASGLMPYAVLLP